MATAAALRRRPPAAVDSPADKLQPIPVPVAARKGKTWPRAVDQTISEPSSIIGDVTGRKYATLSEHAPEAIIQPLKGVKHYAAGGRITLADSAVDNAYETERQNAAASMAAEQAAQAAARDTTNKADVGLAQTLQNTEDQTYAALGVAKPADVAVSPGGSALPNSPLTRASLQTNEQLAAQTAQNVSRVGALSNQAAQATASQARDVESRQRQAVSDQRQVVSDQRQAASDEEKAHRDRGEVRDDNGNWVSAAQDRLHQAETAPVWNATTHSFTSSLQAHQDNPGEAKLPPGQVMDPDTGQIITPAEARLRAAERGVAYDEVNKRFTTHADINQRTDAAGNVRRDDGTWVSKQGNELRDGVWTDPTTGNILVDKDTWQSPDGFKFHITGKSGAGYWEDPDGFTLGGDGIWTNHATGQQKINGVIYSPQQLSAYRATKSSSSAGYSLDDTAPVDDQGTTDYALTP